MRRTEPDASAALSIPQRVRWAAMKAAAILLASDFSGARESEGLQQPAGSRVGVDRGAPPPAGGCSLSQLLGEPFEEREERVVRGCEDRHGASHTVSRAAAARARGEPPSVRRPARTGSRAEATGANVRTGQGFGASV
jgi:hypothetical protein